MTFFATTYAGITRDRAQRRLEEAMRQNVEQMLKMHKVSWGYVGKLPTAKCRCCGSRSFVDHHDRSVCAYCRGDA